MSGAGALLGATRTALAEAWSNRRSFWVQALAMVLNDAVWVAFWVRRSTMTGVALCAAAEPLPSSP